MKDNTFAIVWHMYCEDDTGEHMEQRIARSVIFRL